MNLTIISDTHGLHKTLDFPHSGEVLLHCGDICNSGSMREVYQFINWIGNNMNYDKIIFTLGNHDRSMQIEEQRKQINAYIVTEFGTKMVMLLDQQYIYKGIKFYGTPWTSTFMNWAFMENDDESGLGKRFKRIPYDVDILISHSPPKGILDYVERRNGAIDHLGSQMLTNELTSGRFTNLKYHCFGHIHYSNGKYFDNKSGITYINASLLDESYNQHNPIKNDVMFQHIQEK
jgi:Icc-related predicted phosphoesterase